MTWLPKSSYATRIYAYVMPCWVWSDCLFSDVREYHPRKFIYDGTICVSTRTCSGDACGVYWSYRTKYIETLTFYRFVNRHTGKYWSRLDSYCETCPHPTRPEQEKLGTVAYATLQAVFLLANALDIVCLDPLPTKS